MTQRRTIAGTTLLEMLVALTVMALIAILMASSFSSAGRLLTRTARVTAIVDLAFGRQTLRNWAEQMPLIDNSDPVLLALTGEPSTLRFRTWLFDESFSASEPVNVTVTLDQESVTFTGLGKSSSDGTYFQVSMAISSDTTSLHISYFGTTAEGSGWSETWNEPAGLPELIKIEWIGDTVQPPLILRPGNVARQRAMSLSSLFPPT